MTYSLMISIATFGSFPLYLVNMVTLQNDLWEVLHCSASTNGQSHPEYLLEMGVSFSSRSVDTNGIIIHWGYLELTLLPLLFLSIKAL